MTTTLERPPHGAPCEIASTMAFAHRQVFGHQRSADDSHGLNCACPSTFDSLATRLGTDRGDRLVDLLTKFAYRVHTPDEQTEMLALIQEGRP